MDNFATAQNENQEAEIIPDEFLEIPSD